MVYWTKKLLVSIYSKLLSQISTSQVLLQSGRVQMPFLFGYKDDMHTIFYFTNSQSSSLAI